MHLQGLDWQSPIRWLDEVRTLFPHSVFETIQSHALDRYQMHEILGDPKILDALEPSQNLLRSLIAFKGQANPAVQQKIREVARKVVDEIVRRLRPSTACAHRCPKPLSPQPVQGHAELRLARHHPREPEAL